MNYCLIFYGISRIWVEFKDMLKNFEVDFILKSYKKSVTILNKGPAAQLVRAPACHAGGRRGFESRHSRYINKDHWWEV